MIPSDSQQRMPVLFIGHGNPMNAIEQNVFHHTWKKIADQLPKPKAILCISAHWETHGIYITATEKPETIHDFYGFPKALFEAQYPALGDPDLATHVVEMLSMVGVQPDTRRGLDHGAWSILMAMYPEANIPVVQLSLDTNQPSPFHYHLAKKLLPLRKENVLIIGSGNIVHNLRMFSFYDQTPFDWALQWDEEIKQRLLAGEHESLIAYEGLGSHSKLAVPTPEHYLPLLYSIALQEEGEALSFFNNAVLSSISMTSVMIGRVL
ncbi:aromatic ring-cleaving dioxygenase [Candidatus Nitrosoglobus terrae]|uniref:Aromatic ring-cleaving dioxygenase n=1 Tax=Candidatus Nitrosoglobus terrae TaxID=1630141 RepID=A0A1Q2SNT0_9GAMM|nr:4,5-DOPA dioxygenase extradiol [Candidatus Nitrosoglobus terrae]BAW80757.1 aromatic ring-cleaving dioxygenase [Candidatus Nitrosoglobus terrae]